MNKIKVVWVSYPLKQGLKHAEQEKIIYTVSVWVSYPLKQGLKHQQKKAVAGEIRWFESAIH